MSYHDGIELPEWGEIAEKRETLPKEVTPLENFIYHNEPAEETQAREFRDQLAAVVLDLESGRRSKA